MSEHPNTSAPQHLSAAACPHCRSIAPLHICALVTVLALWSVDGAAGEGSQGPVRAEHAHATLQAMRAPLPPVIDGRLSDEVWSLARPAASFTQRDPDEGKPASERTEVRVLYDDDALYVCARLFDSQPALISRRLSKRDDSSDADQVTIYLDPLLDHLTGVSLRVSASGVQRDSTISNDTFEDSTWDAVWQSAVSIDEEGWSAEVRIPLSQLRFKVAEQQTWGINVERYIRRKNETTWLEFVPKQEAGLASRMAHIDGFDGFRPKTHVQALPYTAARTEFVRPRPGDPFNDGSRGFGAAGVDVKWGITSTFTLDGTINPDFGQVEVDPAVVNLSDVETFFQEKRPFFVEGIEQFSTPGQLVYTRRVIDPLGALHDSVAAHPPVAPPTPAGFAHLVRMNPQRDEVPPPGARPLPLFPVAQPHPSSQSRDCGVHLQHLPAGVADPEVVHPVG